MGSSKSKPVGPFDDVFNNCEENRKNVADYWIKNINKITPSVGKTFEDVQTAVVDNYIDARENCHSAEWEAKQGDQFGKVADHIKASEASYIRVCDEFGDFVDADGRKCKDVIKFGKAEEPAAEFDYQRLKYAIAVVIFAIAIVLLLILVCHCTEFFSVAKKMNSASTAHKIWHVGRI